MTKIFSLQIMLNWVKVEEKCILHARAHKRTQVFSKKGGGCQPQSWKYPDFFDFFNEPFLNLEMLFTVLNSTLPSASKLVIKFQKALFFFYLLTSDNEIFIPQLLMPIASTYSVLNQIKICFFGCYWTSEKSPMIVSFSCPILNLLYVNHPGI